LSPPATIIEVRVSPISIDCDILEYGVVVGSKAAALISNKASLFS